MSVGPSPLRIYYTIISNRFKLLLAVTKAIILNNIEVTYGTDVGVAVGTIPTSSDRIRLRHLRL